MKLFDDVKKMFTKEEAPGDDFLKTVEKNHKATEKRLAAKSKRQIQIEECGAVLRDCRATFEKSIVVENALAIDMQMKGYDPVKQRNHVREAAIGILVVDQALFELQSINSQTEMNSALNKMGMALRQLRRVDNNSAKVSGSTQKLIEKWYPGALSTELEDEDEANLPGMEVPEEMRSTIDSSFVENLMRGDSYDIAMFKHNLAPVAPASTSSNAGKILNDVRTAVHQDPAPSTDHTSVIKQHTGKF